MRPPMPSLPGPGSLREAFHLPALLPRMSLAGAAVATAPAPAPARVIYDVAEAAETIEAEDAIEDAAELELDDDELEYVDDDEDAIDALDDDDEEDDEDEEDDDEFEDDEDDEFAEDDEEDAAIEEAVPAAVVLAWLVLLLTRRWLAEASWIDRAGRCLALAWIAMIPLFVVGFVLPHVR